MSIHLFINFTDQVRQIARMEDESKTIELSDICSITISKTDCEFEITGSSCSTEEVLQALFKDLDLIYRSGKFISNK